MPKPPYMDANDHVKFTQINRGGIKLLKEKKDGMKNFLNLFSFCKNGEPFIGYETASAVYWNFYENVYV